MARFKNNRWNVGGDDTPGKVVSPNMEGAQLAVLMDIRDELQSLNSIFGCYNFTTLPNVIKTIRANTGRIPKQPRKSK